MEPFVDAHEGDVAIGKVTMSALAFLLLCFCTTVVSGDDSTDSVVTAAPGDVAILPCYDGGNVSPTLTSWTKNGVSIISGGPSSAPLINAGPPSSSNGSRLAVLHDGSLNILAVERGDEGTYLCASTLPGNNTFQAEILLKVASGPESVSILINSGDLLPNGTHAFIKGALVVFICSGDSYPSQELTLSFTGLMDRDKSLVNSTGKSLLEYTIDNVQPSAQGIYTCIAHNQVSHQRVKKSAELLVYYASDRHPQCMWTQDSIFIVFHCSWFEAYPVPTLIWTDGLTGHVLASNVTDSLALRINSSLLSEGQTLQCKAQHKALRKEDDRSCTFTLKTPYPVGEPLAAALDGTNITLKCSETKSIPPGITTWRRGLKQDLIMNGSKYIVTENGSLFKLTIVNVTKEDEGVYFCRSENPLGAKMLEVYLTVKTSSAYTGAVIGLFIAVLIVGSAIIIAKFVYSSRHKICLGGFGRMEEDGGDVLSLVESDDEQIFQDTVPRLPPVANGCQTTLVEIHRIPSTDHEDVETVDSNPQQQDNTDKTEEPEELVTF